MYLKSIIIAIVFVAIITECFSQYDDDYYPMSRENDYGPPLYYKPPRKYRSTKLSIKHQ